MKKLWKWLTTSNRWKHLVGGVCVGFLPLNWWAGIYAACAVGLALEYKDDAHGGKWDWIDGMTLGGGCLTLLETENGLKELVMVCLVGMDGVSISLIARPKAE